MVDNETAEVGINTELFYTSVQYYGIIGIGIGVLGVVVLNQLAGGDGSTGGFIGATLFPIILLYAVLSGPIIAAFVGYITNQEVKGGYQTKIISSAVANGIGYIIFGLIVIVFLFFGLGLTLLGGEASTVSANGGGGGGVGGLAKLLALIPLMMIPNALIGGLVTAVSTDYRRSQNL